MANIMIGTIQQMTATEAQENGWVLQNELGKAFLPAENRSGLERGETMDVFLYKGDDGRVIASTSLPAMEAGTFGWGTVTEVQHSIGAFIDVGTDVTMLLPTGDLPVVESVWPEPGDDIYIRLKRDGNDRLLAIPAKEHELDDLFSDASDAALNDSVQGRIVRVGKEGSVMVTEENYRGFIHQSEREKEPRLGEEVTGRIIEVKEDGTLNVSLLPLKHERMDEDAEKIFAYLEANGGLIPIGNKSDADLIKNTFGMSKSAFKRAVGRLFKQGKIKPEDYQIKQI